MIARGSGAFFFLVVGRGLTVHARRTAAAFGAVLVAGAVTTTMFELYGDVERKLRGDSRAYGPNIVISVPPGKALPADSLMRVRQLLGPDDTAVPFAFVVAKTPDGRSMVVVGTDLSAAAGQNASWGIVSSRVQRADAALVGIHVAKPLPHEITLTFQDKTATFTPAASLDTGGAEDDRVVVPLPAFEAWTGVSPGVIEVRVEGSASQVEAMRERIAGAVAEVDVRSVPQIIEGEGRFLAKTRAALLLCGALIAAIAGLCLLATLTAGAAERRMDSAILKALGASDALVVALFAAETVALGLAGAVCGFGFGLAIAGWIARVSFHVRLEPQWGVLGVVLAGTIVVTLLASAAPMAMLRRAEPSSLLKGD